MREFKMLSRSIAELADMPQDAAESIINEEVGIWAAETIGSNSPEFNEVVEAMTEKIWVAVYVYQSAGDIQ